MIRLVLAGLLFGCPARAADLTVLSAGAFRTVAADLIPAYEAASGDKVTLLNDTVGGLLRRISGGEPFDLVLLSPSGLSELVKAGKVVADSQVKLGRVGMGVGVKANAPRPDIGSVAAFKALMLNAKAVAFIDPASGGSSGIYLAKLFQTLGIADVMATKSVLFKGGLAAEAVVDGRASVVVQQISEIVAVPGVTLAGPLPAEIQNETAYSGAVAASSAVPDRARTLLGVFAGPAAQIVLTAKGMTPP